MCCLLRSIVSTHGYPQLRTTWLQVSATANNTGRALLARAHVQEELVSTRPPRFEFSHLLLHNAQEHDILLAAVLILALELPEVYLQSLFHNLQHLARSVFACRNCGACLEWFESLFNVCIKSVAVGS